MIRPADVTVVVCCFDPGRWPLIEDCLASLADQTMLPQAVVVVVDGSAELAATLRRRGGPEEIVVLAENLGPAVARNAGIERVRTDWVAFLDDDATARPDWLERLADACQDTGAIGAGGWVEPSFEGVRPRWLPDELLWTVGCSHRGLPVTRARVRNVFGGCALIRTDALRRCGGFDPQVGRRGDDAQGGEEADLCVRVTQQNPGAVFVHEPSARISHHVPRTRARLGYILRRCLAEGLAKGRLARRHGRRTVGAETAFVLTAPAAVLRSAGQGRVRAALTLCAGLAVAAYGSLRVMLEPPAARAPGGVTGSAGGAAPGRRAGRAARQEGI